MTTATTSAPISSPDGTDARQLRRVAVAAGVGTTIEFYDFFVFGTAAALVFGSAFFPALGPSGGLVAALATFAVAFLARPLGAVLFGRLGDRIGRRRMLVTTLLLMGVATVGVGLLPTADVLGAAAPILLVGLRLLQGLAVGGEWGGAALLVAEHAPAGRRGRWGAAPQLGTGLGFALSSGAFLVCGAALGPVAFAAWGWRIPFLLSVVLVGVGLWVRLRVEETPVFRDLAARDARSTTPLRELVRRDRRTIALAAGAYAPVVALGYLGTVYLVSYGTTRLGVPGPTMLTFGLVGGLLLAAVTLPAARAADRFGRRRALLTGNVATVVALPWLFPLVDTGHPLLVGLGLVLVLVLSAIGLAGMATFLPELFGTRVRCTGAGVAFNLAAVLGGGIPTVLAAALDATWGSTAVGFLYAGLGALGVLCTWRLPETRGTDLRTD